MKKSVLLLAVVSSICFLSIYSYAQAPDWLWAKSAIGTSDDYGYSVAADASGNSYLAGSFVSSTLTFGTTDLTNAGGYDIYLVRYDAGGNMIWAKSFGDVGNEEAYSVTVDGSGNIYLTGYFTSSSIIFGSDTLTNAGSSDIFLAKFDAGGNVLWAKSFGGTDEDYSESVAIDSSGNIFVTGYFKSPTISFGSYTLTNAGSSDIFLAKYDVAGNVLWAKRVGGVKWEAGRSVAVDVSGNIFMTGYFESSSIDFGAYTLTNAGGSDIFIAKYDADGNVLWAHSAGGTYYDYGYSVAVDVPGNCYVTGQYASATLTFGTYILTNEGSDDIFLVKYDASGNVLWATSAGGNDFDQGMDVAVDRSGHPYIAGAYVSTSITIGPSTLTNTGGMDILVAEYDTNGDALWAKSASGSGDENLTGIALDASGDPLVAGNFLSPTLAFDTIILTNPSGPTTYDILFAKLESSTTGIKGLKDSFNFSLFPNPATDKITIEISGEKVECNLTIVNIEGQELITRQINKPKTQIDISSLPGGIYFVRLMGERTIQVGKFIKQ